MMTENDLVISNLKSAVQTVADEYHIKRATLFGSRASGTNTANSDIDLLVEFSAPITLLTISGLKLTLQEMCKLNVDVVHGPLSEDSMLEIEKEIDIYES